jgi:hypothetical protein
MNGGGIVETPSGKVAVVGAAALLAGLCVCLSAGACSTQVVRVVYDGDTLGLEDGTRVRLVGVDAPEVDSPYSHEEPFGRGKQGVHEISGAGQEGSRVGLRSAPRSTAGPLRTSTWTTSWSTAASYVRGGPWRTAGSPSHEGSLHHLRDGGQGQEAWDVEKRASSGQVARRASRISGALKPDHERGLPFLRPLRNTCS